MTCTTQNKTAQNLEHAKHHLRHICPHCGQDMQMQDGHLPFGNAAMITLVCGVCKFEEIKLLQEDGSLFTILTAPS